MRVLLHGQRLLAVLREDGQRLVAAHGRQTCAVGAVAHAVGVFRVHTHLLGELVRDAGIEVDGGVLRAGGEEGRTAGADGDREQFGRVAGDLGDGVVGAQAEDLGVDAVAAVAHHGDLRVVVAPGYVEHAFLPDFRVTPFMCSGLFSVSLHMIGV